MEAPAATRRLVALSRRLRWLIGLALLAFLGLGVIDLITHHHPGPQNGLDIATRATVPVLTLLTAAVILVASRLQPWRRWSLLMLAIGAMAFGFGTAVITTATEPGNPADTYFLFPLAAACLLCHVLLDVTLPPDSNAVRAVEVLAVAGGGVCLATAPWLVGLLMPQSTAFRLLQAALNTVVYLLAVAVIVQQYRSGQRPVRIGTRVLVACCLWLGMLQALFTAVLPPDEQVSVPLLAVVPMVPVGIIVALGCRWTPYPPIQPLNRPEVPMLAVGALAAVVLALSDPPGTGSIATAIGALTIAAVTVRMVLALKQSRVAAGAILLSRTDELTGLPNRRSLMFHLERAVSGAEPFALMILDVDRFKEINDSLGHVAGDIALLEIADRLRACVPEGAQLARLGGDEFAVMVPGGGQEELTTLVTGIRSGLSRPFEVDRVPVSLQAAVGVTVRERPGPGAGELLREADVAMYRAKDQDSGTAFYATGTDRGARTRLQLTQSLREDLDNGRLQVLYSPQVRARDGALVGAEAEVGWRDRSGRVWSMAQLHPLARRAGLMPRLTEQVIVQVSGDSQGWNDQGLSIRVSFTCDPRELHSERLRHYLFDLLDRDRKNESGQRLMIQVTEESFLAGQEKATAAILQMRAHGVQVSIDNYGVGFSSLSFLKDLPIQELRIDASFIEGIDTDTRRRAIVESTAALAVELGIRLVSPEVTSRSQWEILTELGVEVVQGPAVAPLLTAEELLRWSSWRTVAQDTVRP